MISITERKKITKVLIELSIFICSYFSEVSFFHDWQTISKFYRLKCHEKNASVQCHLPMLKVIYIVYISFVLFSPKETETTSHCCPYIFWYLNIWLNATRDDIMRRAHRHVNRVTSPYLLSCCCDTLICPLSLCNDSWVNEIIRSSTDDNFKMKLKCPNRAFNFLFYFKTLGCWLASRKC